MYQDFKVLKLPDTSIELLKNDWLSMSLLLASSMDKLQLIWKMAAICLSTGLMNSSGVGSPATWLLLPKKLESTLSLLPTFVIGWLYCSAWFVEYSELFLWSDAESEEVSSMELVISMSFSISAFWSCPCWSLLCKLEGHVPNLSVCEDSLSYKNSF